MVNDCREGFLSRVICACVYAQSLQSCLTLCNPMDWSLPGSMGLPRQEYWSGLPCPLPGDLPNPEIKSTSIASPALQADFAGGSDIAGD